MTPPDSHSDSRLEDQLATIRHYLQQALDAAEVRHARKPTAVQSLLRLPPRDPAQLVTVARRIRHALDAIAPAEPLDPADRADPADRRLPAPKSQPATTHTISKGNIMPNQKPTFTVENPCPQAEPYPNLMEWLGVGEVCCGCSAKPGQEHLVWCDHAICLVTGQQRAMCQSGLGWHDEDPETHNCGDDVWPGYDRSTRDAINNGWFTLGDQFDIKVPIGHPDAQPDLNRTTIVGAKWNRQTLTWEPKGD